MGGSDFRAGTVSEQMRGSAGDRSLTVAAQLRTVRRGRAGWRREWAGRPRGRAGRRRGGAVVEYAVVYAGLLLPITMMIVFTAQLLWVWNSVIDYTREGARYAVTHCWQPGGSNVLTYMRANTPIMVDRQQFRDGQAEIEVSYFSRSADTGLLEEFTCDGSSCSRQCVPDAVRVRVTNYQFASFLSYLGLPPVSIPQFQTLLPVQSAGCSADTEDCAE